jgi:hypothetical protein
VLNNLERFTRSDWPNNGVSQYVFRLFFQSDDSDQPETQITSADVQIDQIYDQPETMTINCKYK